MSKTSFFQCGVKAGTTVGALLLGTATGWVGFAEGQPPVAAKTASPTRQSAPIRQGTYTNPTIDRDMPDPGIIKDGNGYYMTHTMGGPNEGWPLWYSPDMIHWTFQKHLLTPENKPEWMKDAFWAPEIHRISSGRYATTFTAMNRNTGKLCVGLAFAPALAGPYTVQPQPIVSETVSVLDSHLFQDTNGKKYFFWKRDSDTGQGIGGAIYARELTADASGFAPGSEAVKVLEGSAANTALESVWEKGLVEAPWVLKRGNFYYLFYSGAFIDTTYSLGVARATSPIGPFTRCPGNPILRNNSAWGGPGHGAFALDAQQNWWHLYHAHHQDRPNAGRVQLLDRLYWTNDWPAFGNGGTPSFEPQNTPALSVDARR